MSILSRIFNRTPAAPAAPPAATPIGNVVNIAGCGQPASECNDSFIRRFAGDEYWSKGNVVVHKNLGLLLTKNPVVTENILRTIFEAAGGEKMLSQKDREILDDCFKTEKALDDNLSTYNFFAAGRMRKDDEAKALQDILTGKQAGHVRGHAECMGNVTAMREASHAAKRENSKRVHGVISQLCEKFASSARELVIKCDETERKQNQDRFGQNHPFQASPYLLSLIYAAAVLANNPVRNFKLTGLMACPSPDDIFKLWFNPGPAIKPVHQNQHEAARNQAGFDLAEKAREMEKKQKQEDLEKKNELIQKIKAASVNKFNEDADAQALREVEKEQRRLDAADRYYAKKPEPAPMPAPMPKKPEAK